MKSARVFATAGMAAALSLAGVAIPHAGAPAAHAACSAYKPDGSLNWGCGWPKIPKLSVPRFNYGGPRPALTPKENKWCRSDYIGATRSAGWQLTGKTKYDLAFWPDYSHRDYRGIIYDFKARQWFFVNEWTAVDCDL